MQKSDFDDNEELTEAEEAEWRAAEAELERGMTIVKEATARLKALAIKSGY